MSMFFLLYLLLPVSVFDKLQKKTEGNLSLKKNVTKILALSNTTKQRHFYIE